MTQPRRLPHITADTVLHLAVVALALGTAWIHLSLGGLRFTLNAAGYLVLALALIAPIGIAQRHRWLVRVGLAGYAAATILAWALEPAFYTTAYVAKAIELAILVLLVIDVARHDGNPIDRIRRGGLPPSEPVR